MTSWLFGGKERRVRQMGDDSGGVSFVQPDNGVAADAADAAADIAFMHYFFLLLPPMWEMPRGDRLQQNGFTAYYCDFPA